jgi:uncharacterized protein YbbC (DUF1343 family)
MVRSQPDHPWPDPDDPLLREGRLGLFCNQTAFDFARGEYTFRTLAGYGSLTRLFVPEHGLFAELQDQVPLSDTQVYADLGLESEIVSLYDGTGESLKVGRDKLADLDALVIDIRDVGSRYFTYLISFASLLESLTEHDLSIPVYIIDHPNPAGRQVEGGCHTATGLPLVSSAT